MLEMDGLGVVKTVFQLLILASKGINEVVMWLEVGMLGLSL